MPNSTFFSFLCCKNPNRKLFCAVVIYYFKCGSRLGLILHPQYLLPGTLLKHIRMVCMVNKKHTAFCAATPLEITEMHHQSKAFLPPLITGSQIERWPSSSPRRGNSRRRETGKRVELSRKWECFECNKKAFCPNPNVLGLLLWGRENELCVKMTPSPGPLLGHHRLTSKFTGLTNLAKCDTGH